MVYQGDKYIKLKKFSETKITLTDRQKRLSQELFKEMGHIESKYNEMLDANIDHKMISIVLSLKGGERSSIIEGTRTLFNEFSYDLEEINNVPQWETRNLVNLYEEMFSDNPFYFSLDSYGVSNLHNKLYSSNLSSKFDVTIDIKPIIEKIKPGNIMDDDNVPNFIGASYDIKNANLILLKPSLKKEWLDDLFKTIEDKIKTDSLTLEDVCKMHPIFEAIHPFRDGNGRIGRLLLTYVFSKLTKLKIPLDLSESFSKNNSKEYKERLLNVQLTNDQESWNEWNFYFISMILDTTKTMKKRLIEMIKLWKKYEHFVVKSKLKIYILKQFFKYFNINMKYTVKKIKEKFPKEASSTIYENFDFVVKKLDIKEKNGYYEFVELVEIFKTK